MLAAGSFEMSSQINQTIEDGVNYRASNGTAITNASLLKLRLFDLYLFVGTGGAFQLDPVTGAVIGIDTTNAVGFSIDHASIDLAIAKAAPRTSRSPRPPHGRGRGSISRSMACISTACLTCSSSTSPA